MPMKNQHAIVFLSMAIAAAFMPRFDLERRSLADEKQPYRTFAETLKEQEAELAKNPPMPRLDESREKTAGKPDPPRKILDILSEADVRDIDLLAGLDPDYPPVAGVVKLYRAGKIGDAKRALCNHFRNRTIGWPYFTREDVKRFPRHAHFPGNVYPGGPTLLGRATMMLDNRLHDNWNAGTSADLGPDFNWQAAWDHERHQTSLLRNFFVHNLSISYGMTGDERFAAKLREALLAWFRTYPMTPEWFKLHDGYMNTGNRMFHWTEAMNTGFLQSEHCDDEFLFRWLTAVWYQGGQYQRIAGGARHGNHHQWECGSVPVFLACYYPEFSEFHVLFDRGREALQYHLEECVYADGGYEEHSVMYTAACLRQLYEPFWAAKCSGRELFDRRLTERLHGMVRFLLDASTPDGEVAEIGDHYSNGSAKWLLDGVIYFRDAEIKTALLEMGLETPPMSDTFRGTWDALPRKLPDRTTAYYPDCGYVFFRDRWAKDGLFMGLSCDPKPFWYHDQNDALSFVVNVGRRGLLADPASEVYHAREHPGYPYQRVFSAHNVVLLDGNESSGNQVEHEAWQSDDAFDFYSGSFRGRPFKFTQSGKPPNEVLAGPPSVPPWRRDVLFVRGRYWVVVDRYDEIPADKSHEYHQLFHFDFDVDVEVAGSAGRFWTKTPDANLMVVPLAGDPELRIQRDEKLYGKMAILRRTKPWLVKAVHRGQGTVLMPFLILPYSGLQPPEVKIVPVEIAAAGRPLGPEEAVAVRICGDGWSDLFVHSRVRPFSIDAKHYDTATLLVSTAAGRPGPVFLQSDKPLE